MKRTFGAIATMVTLMLWGATAEGRHVAVTYVDANRPPEFSQADVVAAIQRVMREWEAHNANSAIVFHWNGIIPLSGAAEDFNNLVIRWLPSDYTDLRAGSCNDYEGCEWVWNDPQLPTGHIALASAWDYPGTTPPSGRWNNPRWTFGTYGNQDLVSGLMHEMGHMFRNTGDSSTGAATIMRPTADFPARYLWNADINGMDNGRYPGHYQTLQMFSISPTDGGAFWIGQSSPPFRVLSPASLATGNGVGATGAYTIAYATRTPANSAGQNNAFVVRLTDGNTNHLDRVVQGTLAGVAVGTSFHRPCVAVSAPGTSHYLVWASPVEFGGGWRQVLSMESHDGMAATWSQPEVIPGAWTRSGVSCSVDRSTERLVVAFSGAGEEGIFLTHRPTLTAGAGQWGPVIQLMPGFAASYGPPDVAFDFFSSNPNGVLTWQQNSDLQVYSASLYFSSGTYYVAPFSALPHTSATPATLRSWPLSVFEGSAILGLSKYTAFATPALAAEQRSSFPFATPSFVAGESYPVGGGSNPARHYTGAASNRFVAQRALLSTGNLGQ